MADKADRLLKSGKMQLFEMDETEEKFKFSLLSPFSLRGSRETLTLSCRRSLSYRNQCINLPSKSMDWFLYDTDLWHERVQETLPLCIRQEDEPTVV